MHQEHVGSRNGKLIPAGFDEVSGGVTNLTIGSGHRVVQGRRGPGVAVNGSVPGPLIIAPRGGESLPVDRDYIVLISEFATLDPHFIIDRLRAGGNYFN